MSEENEMFDIIGDLTARIEKLENCLFGKDFLDTSLYEEIKKLQLEISELKTEQLRIKTGFDGWYDTRFQDIKKKISELQKYNKTFRRFINRICLEQVQTDNNRIKDISELFNILKKWGLYNDK